MNQHLYLGIDGGGTRCRARLRNGRGELLAEAEGGLANIYQEFDEAIACILRTAREAARAAGLAEDSLRDVHAGLGLAGVTSDESAARVAAAGLPFRTVAVDNDAYVACLGAHGGRDGGIVISGTGSAALALVGDRRFALGGWGFVLGDDGSGAVIGRDALRRAILAHDELVPPSPLLRTILARFDDDVPRLVDWARTALSRDFGAFAPLVFEAAGQDDPHAREILDTAATAVAALARGLVQRGAPRVALIGSVARALEPTLPGDVRAVLVAPVSDPIEGAIIMATRKAGATVEGSP